MRAFRVFGHPLHAMLIHFPMAALALVFPLDLAGWWLDSAWWWQLARATLVFGVAAAVVASGAGLLDLMAIPPESPAMRVANVHLLVMLAAVSIFAVDAALRIDGAVLAGGTRMAAVALSAFGLVTLLVGGWYGGELIHRHRIGQIDDPALRREP